MSDPKVVMFEKEKETKNMVRFSEIISDGESPFVRTAYIPKTWIKNHNKVKITYEIFYD